MELLKKIGYLLSAVFLMTSCLPEEDPVPPVDRGGMTTVQIEMGGTYTDQVWYNLSAQEVIKTVNRYSYDMIYDPTLTIAPIGLNSARISSIAATGSSDFSTSVNPTDYTYYESDPSGIQDSSAFAKVDFEYGKVYLVKLGVNESGNQAGYKKIRLTKVDDVSYLLEHGKPDDKSPTQLELSALANMEQRAIHFGENTLLDILPRHDEYDVLFTNYTHLFYTPYLAYSVTGMLLNAHNVEASELDDSADFLDVTSTSLDTVTWSSELDEVGYDWKWYSLETSSYTVYSDRTFVLNDRYGYHYKMRFIDFYNSQGERGYPTFEIERL